MTKSIVLRHTAQWKTRVCRKGRSIFYCITTCCLVDENDLFADVEPDICEEEFNEFVVYED